jgi:malonate transporter
LIIGIALGFVVNFSDINLPIALTDALDMVVRAALPAALFGMGGVLFKYRPDGDLRTIGYVCGISLLLHPVIVWFLGSYYDLSSSAFRSAVITAAMPTGVNGYVFANMYGRARRVAASSVLLGTALSIFTISLWLLILP